AAEEGTTAAAFDDHWRAALFARDAGLDWLDRVAVSIDVLGVAAFRVGRAGQERTARPLAQHHRRTALVAHVFGRPAGEDRLALGADSHRCLALGVARAAEERSAAAHAFEHRLAAVGTGVFGFNRGLARFPLARLDVLALGVAGAAKEAAHLA